jgi:hypothetical protein
VRNDASGLGLVCGDDLAERLVDRRLFGVEEVLEATLADGLLMARPDALELGAALGGEVDVESAPVGLGQAAFEQVLALLYIPKFGQEYLLHFSEATPWNWFKETILSINS